MKAGALVLLVTLFVCGYAMASWQTVQNAPPQLTTSDADDNSPIPSKIINEMYDSCKYNIPSRFTPDAREYYCACNAAAVQGNFRMKEYRDLQKKANQKPSNKTYEKYITKAVSPCLDMPVEQIEYLECVLDSSIDVRIRYVPAYCRCVSKTVRKHAEKFANTEILTRLTEYPSGFKDPVDALWDNQTYITARVKATDDCIINRNIIQE